MTSSQLAAIEDEITEIVCEILDLERFELMSPTVPFTRYENAHSQLGIDILLTIQCAFGVEIDQSEVPRMVNVNGVLAVLLEALAVKHASR